MSPTLIEDASGAIKTGESHHPHISCRLQDVEEDHKVQMKLAPSLVASNVGRFLQLFPGATSGPELMANDNQS